MSTPLNIINHIKTQLSLNVLYSPVDTTFKSIVTSSNGSRLQSQDKSLTKIFVTNIHYEKESSVEDTTYNNVLSFIIQRTYKVSKEVPGADLTIALTILDDVEDLKTFVLGMINTLKTLYNIDDIIVENATMLTPTGESLTQLYDLEFSALYHTNT